MEVLVSILHNLNINDTFFTMLGIFIATYILVSNIALKPLAEGLIEREHRIEGREEQVHKLKGELDDIQEKLAAEMKRARIEANDAFVAFRNKATAEQRAILTGARDTAAAEIKAVRTSVAEKMQQELKKLEDEVPKLAKLMIDQILSGGRSSGKSSSAAMSTEV